MGLGADLGGLRSECDLGVNVKLMNNQKYVVGKKSTGCSSRRTWWLTNVFKGLLSSGLWVCCTHMMQRHTSRQATHKIIKQF